MSEFYGSLQGSRGCATRCGTKSSGICATAQSWEGSVTVDLYKDDNGDNVVSIRTREGSGHGGRTLFYGPLAKILRADSLRPVTARKKALDGTR